VFLEVVCCSQVILEMLKTYGESPWIFGLGYLCVADVGLSASDFAGANMRFCLHGKVRHGER